MKNKESIKVPRFVPLLTPLVKMMLMIGVPMGPNTLVSVRGRRSGKTRTTPVALMEHDGHKYLLATFGEVNWVRNLRSAGEASIGRGRRRVLVSAIELAPSQATLVFRKVLSPYLASPMTRAFLRTGYDLDKDASDEDFLREAHRHPVFEVVPK
jgi:deazaflavin-dependent oxidoreductase (nitroreductase family)